MKYVLFLILSILVLACQEKNETAVDLQTHQDSISYAIGHDIGRNLKRQTIDLDLHMLARGITDSYTGTQGPLTDSSIRLITADFRKERMKRRAAAIKAQAEKNRKEAEVFFAENGKKNSVVTLRSGLQYKVITMGTGKKPRQGQSVVVKYRGTLLDGTEFYDSDKDDHGTATLAMSGLIEGWKEALPLMPVGSKWILYVPPDLGYGERGSGNLVPPGAGLIFEIELLKVQ
jgi:FKBP-type peptidyl-prolyl cis-trans isomerase